MHVCVDYCALNNLSVIDCYLMLHINEMIDTVGRCQGKYFMSLDLMKGYHQVTMAESQRKR